MAGYNHHLLVFLEKKMRKSILFLVLAVLLAACSPAAASIAPAANPNANPVDTAIPPQAAASPIPTVASSNPVAAANCTVLSKDEVGAIMGETVLDVRDPAKDGSLCVYQTQSLILELNTQTIFGGYVDSVNFMKQFRDLYTANGDTPLDVPELGDEAFYHGGSGFIRALFVRKGAVVYSFAIRNITTDNTLSSPANVEPMEKALADLILTRAP
jgi:hypothetical protein